MTHHHKHIDLNKAARGEQTGLPGKFSIAVILFWVMLQHSSLTMVVWPLIWIYLNCFMLFQLDLFIYWAPTGMFVTYEISPLMVEVTEHRRSFTHFLTGVCAIVGGVFTGNGFIVFETIAGAIAHVQRRVPTFH